MEKFLQSKFSFEKIQLVKLLNTHTMTVHMTDEIKAKIAKELDH